MYDPTGHQPGAVPSRVLTALRGETKRLDVPAVTGAQAAAPPVTHTLTLHVDASAFLDATQAAFKGGGPLRRPNETATFLPEHPSLRPGETLIHDRAGKLVRRITPDAARSTPDPIAVVCPNGNTEAAPAGLSDLPTPERRSVRMLLADEIDTPDPTSFSRLRAELAQRRAEVILARLDAITGAGASDPAAYAADMAATNLAAAQALLSAHVLWRARAEAGGLTVPAPPLSAASDNEQGA